MAGPDFHFHRDRARDYVKRVLSTRGLEVRRTARGVRRTFQTVLSHYAANGFRPAVIVDVGVAGGTPGLYEPFPGARLVLVEPIAEWVPTLERMKAGGREVDIVSAAAGRALGEVDLEIHRVPEMSSMVGARPGDASHGTMRRVPMVTLDSVADGYRLDGPVLLKIDVEGAELEVLEGAVELLGQCELVLIELSFVALIEGAPLFAEVVAWMDRHGFAVAEFYDGHNRPLDGALAQLDVAFLPTHSRFRAGVGYATPAVSDALYRSWAAAGG